MLQVSKRATFFGHTCQSCSFLEEKTEKRLSSVKISDLFTCGWRLRGVGILVELLEEINYLHRFPCCCQELPGHIWREGWSVFCISSSPLWADTLSPPYTCWRIRSFFTRGNAQPFTASTSRTEEVRWYVWINPRRSGYRDALLTGNVIAKRTMCCREEWLSLSLDPETSGKVS